MFVPYLKRTGEIVTPIIIHPDEISIDIVFGENAQDYKLIYDYINIPNDEYVLRNSRSFKVNIQTKQLELKADSIPQQYPIAAQ